MPKVHMSFEYMKRIGRILNTDISSGSISFIFPEGSREEVRASIKDINQKKRQLAEVLKDANSEINRIQEYYCSIIEQNGNRRRFLWIPISQPRTDRQNPITIERDNKITPYKLAVDAIESIITQLDEIKMDLEGRL